MLVSIDDLQTLIYFYNEYEKLIKYIQFEIDQAKQNKDIKLITSSTPF
jgi:hypothetical protein